MLYQWLIFVSIFMFGETMLRIFINDPVINIFSLGWVMSLLFVFTFACIFVLFLTLIPMKYHVVFQLLTIFMVVFLYTTQILYHDIFRTFYTFQSAQNVGQGLGFKSVILSTISDNLLIIVLLFIPIFIYLIIYYQIRVKVRDLYITWRNSRQLVIISIIGIILSYVITFGFTQLDDDTNELFHDHLTPNLAVEHLGLMMMMRLDTQRYLLDWSPPMEEDVALDVEAEPLPVFNNEETVEDDAPVEALSEENIEYNVLPIDFNQLIALETNDTIKNMHRYFNQVKPTVKNEYTGMFKDYNLIVLTAESFTYYAIDEDVTPTLHKLSTEGIQFGNFYTPIWNHSTTDGEYVALHGLLPDTNVWSFEESAKNNVPFVLGNQMKEKGYTTKAYHNHTYTYYGRHKSHPNMGYDYKGVGNGLEVKQVWPASDLEMMEKTIDEYIHDEPFHAYYMTVSGHLEYSFNDNSMAYKNKHLVNDLPLSNQAKAYMATQIELDRALEKLIQRLEEADVLDHTLIVLSGDHYPYGLDNDTIEELSGEKLDEKFEIYKNDLIIYATHMDPIVVEEPASSMDILPTVSNLMGIDYDSRLLMGRDVFSTNSDPLVVFKDKSFITNKGKFYRPNHEFIPFDQENKDDPSFIDEMKKEVSRQFYYSTKILEENYYNHLSLDQFIGKNN